MGASNLPITAALVPGQPNARRMSRSMMANENHEGEALMETQDEAREAGYVIYVYNLLDREHRIEQPPSFPRFIIPACPKGEEFVFTTLPPFVREKYNRAGTSEYYYKKVDGRKAATSLLNPNAFPGTDWKSQLGNWENEETAIAGDNNNLNRFGVFWSLTRPDEVAKLRVEIDQFKKRVTGTMTGLIKLAEALAANGDLKSITPLMHFAMDYTGKQAPWHMPTHHMVTCPNCGEMVRDGIFYHKNSMGDRCIVDVERYKAHVKRQREIEAEVADLENEPVKVQASAEAPRAPRKKASIKA